MIVTKAQKQPKLKVVAAKPAAAVEATTHGIGVSQDTIRQRAFQIYESRGSTPGHAIQDWLHAENQILAR
jgi:hypothetical protein